MKNSDAILLHKSSAQLENKIRILVVTHIPFYTKITSLNNPVMLGFLFLHVIFLIK